MVKYLQHIVEEIELIFWTLIFPHSYSINGYDVHISVRLPLFALYDMYNTYVYICRPIYICIIHMYIYTIFFVQRPCSHNYERMMSQYDQIVLVPISRTESWGRKHVLGWWLFSWSERLSKDAYLVFCSFCLVKSRGIHPRLFS